MKMILAIIRPNRLGSVKAALHEAGFSGITASSVKGCGSQRGIVESYRGSKYVVDLLDKVEIKVVVNDNDLDRAMQVICDAARSGEFGDGKIFVLNVEESVRIRTNDRGLAALENR